MSVTTPQEGTAIEKTRRAESPPLSTVVRTAHARRDAMPPVLLNQEVLHENRPRCIQ